jgi:hypothetical protein
MRSFTLPAPTPGTLGTKSMHIATRYAPTFLLVTALSVVPSLPALAAAAGATTIDWDKRVITARGQGAPDLNAANPAAARIGAERAAEVDAFRNLLEALKGVEIKSGQTVGQAMAQDPALRASVEGVVRGFRVTNRRYFNDGGVELTVEMPLDGKVAQLLLVPDAQQPAKAAKAGAKEVGTGLVVVAKGLKLVPALAPRILDEQGHELYGPDFVEPGALRKNGIAGYLSSTQAAQGNSRVGPSPLVVKAIRSEGSDLVLSSVDAARLTDAQADLGFLSEGKVIIVTD